MGVSVITVGANSIVDGTAIVDIGKGPEADSTESLGATVNVFMSWGVCGTSNEFQSLQTDEKADMTAADYPLLNFTKMRSEQSVSIFALASLHKKAFRFYEVTEKNGNIFSTWYLISYRFGLSFRNCRKIHNSLVSYNT